MNYKLFTTIEKVFLTSGGIIIAPDFPINQKHNFKPFKTISKIKTKSGREYTCETHINCSHFNTKSSDINKRWRIVIIFPDSKLDVIKVGNDIYFNEEDYNKLNPI